MAPSSNNENGNDHRLLIAAVEGGGTSFKVAVCYLDTGEIVHRATMDSSQNDPSKCLRQCAAFFQRHNGNGGHPYAALGIAMFGPLGLNPADTNTYGRILPSSPKQAWRHVDIVTPLQRACGECPTFLDTDVNAPAVAEYQAAVLREEAENSNVVFSKQQHSISSCAYVTVGTGVGVGLVVNHKPVHGLMHPEGGHVPVQPLPGDTFGGYSWGRRIGSRCPFGGVNTVEGLASSVALTERRHQLQSLLQEKQVNNNTTSTVVALGRDCLKDLPDDCEIWDHCANAIANLCTTLLLTLSMERIVLGGGVLQRQCLLDKIRHRTAELLNEYLDLGSSSGNKYEALKSIITTSQYGDDAGLVGAIALAQRGLLESSNEPKETAVVNTAAAASKREKQCAFQYGLWYGFMVGVVGTALLVKYGFGRKESRK